MKIIKMEQSHIPALADLEALCFSAPWSTAALTEELHNPQAVFLTAVDGDTVLGYGGMHLVLGEGYVDNIAVFPQYRRQGAAKALLKALYEKTDGYLTLEVRASNAPALALYAALGFYEAGRRPRFYENPSEDALILTKGEPKC